MNLVAQQHSVLLDFSFKEIRELDELMTEEPRVAQRGIGPLKALRLYYNRLSSFSPLPPVLKTMTLDICWLDLSFNSFVTIDPVLAEFVNLGILYLHANQIEHVNQVDVLKPLTKLKTLTLHGNPVEKVKGYRSLVVSKLPTLRHLDFTGITHQDRTIALSQKLKKKQHSDE